MQERNKAKVIKDPLFVALTRVPTALGVPYAAFVLELIFASLMNIITGNPLYALLVIPLHIVLYAISSHDPGIFAEIAVWLTTIGRCLNKGFWNAASFSPIRTSKWKE